MFLKDSIHKLSSKGFEEMDEQKVLIQIQTEIGFTENKIAELTKEGRDVDKVYYQGMLQAYKNMENRLKNNK